MPPTHMELLLASARLDQKLAGFEPTIQAAQPTLIPEEEDPFGGNENNRRVAELYKKQEEEAHAGVQEATPTMSDEELAARAVNVPVAPATPQGPAVTAPVTAASKAQAKKAAKEAAKVAPSGPPAWNPNS